MISLEALQSTLLTAIIVLAAFILGGGLLFLNEANGKRRSFAASRSLRDQDENKKK